MSNLTKFVLRRPVTTFLAVLCLVFFGIMSLLNSKLELMQEMEFPMMLVTTTYAGASPEDVDKLVTKKIEDGVAVLEDVNTIQSQSNENFSTVMIRYNYGTDMDKAYDNLKKKVDSIKPNLPSDAKEPNFVEINVNQSASLYLAVNNPTQENMYNYVDDEIKPQIEKISSVASVSVYGGRKEYIQVQLIPELLSQYHITMSTISQAISMADLSYPAGSTGVGSQELSVTTSVKYDEVDLLRELPIITGNGDTIYLKDVALVQPTLEKQSTIGRYNGSDTVTLGITKTQDQSAVTMSRAVMAQLDVLKAEDSKLDIKVVRDSAETILDSLSSVFQTMILAVIISMVVIFIFFGDFKASFIVGTSIPIAILGALVFMWGMGYSMNIITLSALVLGVGMMVDNSIVVLEACFRAMDRYRDVNGHNLREAAVESVKVVGSSVFGSTATTCVVFLPLGFMQGLSGQFFQPLGFTIVFCMVASLISAVTIVPLCFAFYRPRENSRALGYKIVRVMQDAYRVIMRPLIKHKFLVLLATVGLLVLSFRLASQIKMELMPQTDEGTVTISVATRAGLKIEEVDKILKSVEKQVAADPDTEDYMVSAGGSGLQAMISGGGNSITVYLKDDRVLSTKEFCDKWRKKLQNMTDAVVTVESSGTMSTMSSDRSNYETIISSTDMDKLKEASDGIVSDLQKRKEVTAVHSSMENAAPLIRVNVDTLKAAAEGITATSIGQQLHAALSGTEAKTMDLNGENVSIMVEYPDDEYDSLEKLQGMMLTTSSGKQVKLDNVANIEYHDSPSSIVRYDRRYQATITADFTDYATATTIFDLEKEVVAPYLNNDIEKQQNTQDTRMGEEFSSLGSAIAIAVFLVFVVMAAQFESMRYSIMVMTTIPFSLIGSFGLLWLADATLSMNSLLGFLMLVGTVVNNGILYVDTVNQYKEEMPLNRALIEAGATRLRPILMTTLTTVLSMIPMAIGYGRNGEMMQGLALVDVGGLTASTVLALFMLPAYYLLMTRKKKNVIKHIPNAGYMEGKDPKEEYKKSIERERAFRKEWEYSEGESYD